MRTHQQTARRAVFVICIAFAHWEPKMTSKDVRKMQECTVCGKIHTMQKILSLGRIARARKAGSTVTKKKQAASRANLAKGRRKMDPDIKKIMSERGVTRQRAHQIRNAPNKEGFADWYLKKRDADLAKINKELGELFDGVKKLKRK